MKKLLGIVTGLTTVWLLLGVWLPMGFWPWIGGVALLAALWFGLSRLYPQPLSQLLQQNQKEMSLRRHLPSYRKDSSRSSAGPNTRGTARRP